MDALTIIRKLLLRASLLLGFLVALTLFINLSWFDEALHPDLERLVTPQDVSMADNVYPLIYGFSAAEDRDFRQAGMDIIARLRERFERGERATLTGEEIESILGTSEIEDTWREALPALQCNARSELDCADRLIVEIQKTGRLEPRVRLLLSRYETILDATRFAENQEFDAYTPIPAYRPLLDISRVRLAAGFSDRPIDELLDAVRQDVQFWRLVLRDGQSLVAKMVALAGLRNDATFLSALMRSRSPDQQALERIARIAAPLTNQTRDIGETFLAELRISLLSSKGFGVLSEGPSWLHVLALQERATINEYYLKTTVALRLRASLSAEEFFRQRGYEPLSYEVRAFPPPLYNLGGKFVLKWIASEMNVQDYISRVHDLDGRLALVALQAEVLARAGHPAAEVVRLSDHRNPYTREPMDWDPAAGTIGFDCLANGSDTCALLVRNR
ncbi:MAG TPA: hypothetical protein VKQ06_05240 [Gammaproteobacteria bacterium]|nr:hypothetical protein [Gammaproteobacteria bacterium]